MDKVSTQEKLLREVLQEVRRMRRDLSLVVPSESLSDYENADEIADAYKDVKQIIDRKRFV